MDNASAYGAEDCRFDPCQDRFVLFLKNFIHLDSFQMFIFLKSYFKTVSVKN